MCPALPLPPDVLLDIAALSKQPEHLALARVSKAFHRVYNPVIYRLNYVKSNAKKFVHSLANNPRLPRLVLKLIFDESPDTAVDIEEWAAVLPAMVNLHYIGIVPTIPLPCHVLPLITFRLWGFGSTGDVVGPWAELVASQSELEELRLESDFFGVIPGPTHLPCLRLIQGRPADIARCAQHQLQQVWFYRGPPFGRRSLKDADLAILSRSPARLLDIRICARYFTRLLDTAPQMLSTLRHILLDEELDWSNFTIDAHAPMANSIKNLAAALTRTRFPRLESVLLIWSQSAQDRGTRRLLSRANGAHCLKTFETHLLAPNQFLFTMLFFEGMPETESKSSEHPAIQATSAPRVPSLKDRDNVIASASTSRRHVLQVPYLQRFRELLLLYVQAPLLPHCWDGFYYNDEIAASALGLSLRLAHGEDGRCIVPIVERDVPVLTSELGILKIDMEFCGCDPLASRHLQLISVGMVPSVVAGVPGATEVRWFFLEQDRRGETARRRREPARRRMESLKPYVQPLPILPPIPPRKRRSPPSHEEGAAQRVATEFSEQEQASWDAVGKQLAAIASAWREGKVEDERPHPAFAEYLAQIAPPVPLRGIPGLCNVAETATAGYAQLLARVERLRKADEERTKAFELLTSSMWQEHEKTFTNCFFKSKRWKLWKELRLEFATWRATRGVVNDEDESRQVIIVVHDDVVRGESAAVAKPLEAERGVNTEQNKYASSSKAY
ncbi:hypothetical protein B0H16DRAFT_1461139 [Mycena metata]|uniref:CxC2-like cysteine cluster KDZ transposase-associated domain-containing protein n=1 Tax=Mycena metata TaxID=1033252 RepID=A0AAD7IV25_9AGAR|nr:hypothetical protein B0H16DRAFT_1461139 [Mycena metata]